MNFKLLLVLVGALLISVHSCEKKSTAIGLDDEVTIKFNRSATLYDNNQQIEIRFKTLVSESRCPPGKVCFWEGAATIEIEVNNTEIFELVTCPNKPHCLTAYSANYQDYDIELLAVTFDKDSNYGKESKYSITIKVTK